MTVQLIPGAIYRVGADAGAQFRHGPALLVRLIRVNNEPTWEGQAFLYVYQLNEQGEAVEQREIYVTVAGLVPVDTTPRPVVKARNARIPVLPGQRRVPTGGPR